MCPRGHTFRKAVTFMRTVRQPCEDCRLLGPLPEVSEPEWDDVGLLIPPEEDDEDF
ncbi:MAG: hypothetical protein U0838_06940 [Chloroflexota bacterium]